MRTEAVWAGCVAALVLGVASRSVPAAAADPTSTVGFVFGSVAVIRRVCGFADDPNGLGRLLVNARLTRADILPGGRRRGAFQEGADEARLTLHAKMAREGRDAFCAFALQRYGAAGLGVVRG